MISGENKKNGEEIENSKDQIKNLKKKENLTRTFGIWKGIKREAYRYECLH